MRFAIAGPAAVGFTLTCCGCSEKAPVVSPAPPPRQPKAVLVWFTEVEAPASVNANDTLLVLLSGVAGSNGCYTFDHLEATRTASAVEITGHGLHHKSVVCPAVLPVFENVEHLVLPPFTMGQFKVVARQPDGSEIERAVSIGPPR